MMKLSQRYMGTASAEEVNELREQGYEIVRRGSLFQVFGHGSLPSPKRIAFRGEVWKGPKRDSLQLHIDTEKIVKRMVPILREEVRELQDPAIKLNYIRKMGHGHSLHLIDQHRNETLDIHVAATPWDHSTWIHWRLTHWTDQGRDVYQEGSLDYPDEGPWDDEKMQKKAVDAVLKHVRKWMQGEDRP